MTIISVIVPTLNRNKEILFFVNTLKQQTMPVHELIVVDAGKSGNLQSQLQQALQDTEIDLQYATSEPGTSLQRNVAIDICKGDILFFLGGPPQRVVQKKIKNKMFCPPSPARI